ncbi:MAG: RNA polymerase sigma factor [Salibacteraceae bacterium]
MEFRLNIDIQELIKGCKKRDAECQKQLFKAYYGRMLGTCLRYCNNKQDAQDVTQEGFIKLFEKIDLYNSKGSFDGWIRRIFINLSLDHLRKNKTHLVSIDSETYPIDLPGEADEEFDESLLNRISPERLIEEIQKLSPVYRTVLNLFVYEGCSHEEISQELGISIGTSKSNLSKAKGNLRKALKEIVKAKHAS